MIDDFLRLRHLVALTGFSKPTLIRWIRSGNGPRHFRTPTGIYVFPRDDAERWLEGLRENKNITRAASNDANPLG